MWMVGFSSDGKHLLSAASAASAGSIKVCDSYSGEQVHAININNLLTAAGFSLDGTRICASFGGHIRVWDAGSGALVKTVKPAEAGQVSQLRFSPDATQGVSCSDAGLLQIWSIES